jgi:hypothetical protein
MMTKPIKASSVCHGKRYAVRKNKIEGKKLPTACKSMNISNTLATMGKLSASRAVYGRVLGAVTQSPNTKNYTKYDQDFKQSRKLHFDTCKKHQSVCLQSIENRKFTSTDKEDFEALLGKGDNYADHMPSSDMKLRNKMVKLLIDELSGLLNRAEADPSLTLYWITFVGDRYMINERGGTAEVHKLKVAVQAAIRTYTSFHAIGVIENQAVVNYPKDQEGKSLSVHAHVLCWGTSDDAAELKKRAKGFKSSITKLPIHSKKVHLAEGSIGKLARYMSKPPYSGKEVDFGKLEEGSRCLFNARRLELHHHLRLFEYSAKLPMEQTLFGVGEGTYIRNRVVIGMKNWQKARTGSAKKLGGRVYTLFEDFLRENKRLKNYQPLIVNYSRDGSGLGLSA